MHIYEHSYTSQSEQNFFFFFFLGTIFCPCFFPPIFDRLAQTQILKLCENVPYTSTFSNTMLIQSNSKRQLITFLLWK